MDGTCRSLAQHDSQEMQPPEVPLEGPSMLLLRRRLVPDTDCWFGNRDVARAISKNIQTHYKEVYTCWRDAPEDHKSFWWNCFKQQFTWDPQHEALVRREWQEKVRVRLKDMVYKAANEPLHKITWMADGVRASLKYKRETSEEFKKRSERNRRNKAKGPKYKIRHSRGSISATIWAMKLTKQLNRGSSTAELFAATHSKVDENGRRIWCDAHAQSVYEKYEQLKVDANVQAGSEVDDHIFFEALRGWGEKGTLYELGREGPAMSERPSKSRRCNSGTSLTYSLSSVTQLQDQLQTIQNKLQTTQARLHSIEEEVRATREEVRATKEQVDEQRLGLLALNARFDSFLVLLGYPTRADNSQQSSEDSVCTVLTPSTC